MYKIVTKPRDETKRKNNLNQKFRYKDFFKAQEKFEALKKTTDNLKVTLFDKNGRMVDHN